MSKLIIFDMDGTVINSGKMLCKTVNAVREHFDLHPLEKEVMLHALNDPDINSAQFFYNTPSFTPKQLELFESYYHKYCVNEIELYEGIHALLQKYHKEFDLAIATNAHTAFAQKMLGHLEIAHYFKSIVGADLVQKPKPHPDMIELTLQKFTHPKEKSILIGDSLKDKRAAQAAGIKHTIVSWGFTVHEDEENIIHEVKALDEVLTRL